jgi:hypothetical protein
LSSKKIARSKGGGVAWHDHKGKGFFGPLVESFAYSRINEVSASKDVFRGDLMINSGASTERIQGIWKAQLKPFLHLVQQTLAEFRYGGPMGSPGLANHLDTAS